MPVPGLHLPHRYDATLRLKVPFFLWLAMLYGLVQPAFLFPQVRQAVGVWSGLFGDWRLVAAYAPVLLVLVAAGYRVPETGHLMRGVWRHGRELMLAAYGLGAAIFAVIDWSVLSRSDHILFPLAAAILLLNGAVLGYLVRSRLLRDLFADFPEAADREVAKVAPATASGAVAPGAVIHAELVAGSAGLVTTTPDGQTPAQAMLVAAERVVANRLAEAEHTYRQILAEWPNFSPAWHELGLLAVSLGKMPEAAALVRQAVAFDAANALYQRNLCEIYRRLGRLQEALRAGQNAARLAPADADAHYNLALAQADARRPQEAIASYRTAVHLNPAHVQAWNNIGVLLRQLGNDQAARLAYIEALRLQPGHAEARRNLERMDARQPASMAGGEKS
jgi:tetratricopeptide (TPR) repeat protein